MTLPTVKAETEIEFERWRPPNFALIAQDPSLAMTPEGQAVKVEKLRPSALAALAQAWIDDLYAKAGQKSPFDRNAY